MPKKLLQSERKRNRFSSYIIPAVPRVRKLFFEQVDKDASLTLKHLSEELKGIALREWRVYQLTPLFGVIYDRNTFADYEKSLLSYILKEKKTVSDATTTNQNVSYKVKLSVKNDFRVIKDDPKAIKIEIIDKTDPDNIKPLFLGYLLSVERKEDLYTTRFRNSKLTILPLFLASGKQYFTQLVIEFLTEKFSTYITPLHFPSHQLAWMLTMWAGYRAESSLKPLYIEYSTSLKDLKTIQFSINVKSTLEIWSKIHEDPEESEIKEEEVNAFMNSLNKHFKTLFHFDLNNFQMVSIGTSVAAVSGSGKIKIFCASALPSILRHLTHLAQEML